MDGNSEYILQIDTPTRTKLVDRRVELKGWLVSLNYTKKPIMRLKTITGYIPIEYPQPRPDVADAFPHLDSKKATDSGFECDFEYAGGKVEIELDQGNGYGVIHEFDFSVRDESSTYNPHMGVNWENHLDIKSTKSHYYFEHESDNATVIDKDDPKVVALYLPQFHPIKENDLAWGKGFTEWRNVAAATPRFAGHHQPILPRDFGYYDLRVEDNIKDQIDLAKDRGIYGFCLYYYWFSGEKILDAPINSIMNHPEWDFNFMICWANENWTKRWDGRDREVIIAQKYREEDPLRFIKDVEHILLDERYIRHEGKPVLAVYRCEHLDDAKRYVKVWRDYFKKEHGLELHLISVMSFTDNDPRQYDFDAGMEFSPSCILRSTDPSLKQEVDVSKKLIDTYFSGSVFDYRAAVIGITEGKLPNYSFPTYPCVVPSWDNDARKKGDGSYVLYNESPKLYEKWLSWASAQRSKDLPFTFINAWNEWAEGTVLEPTMHYGHAHINATSRAIQGAGVQSRNSKKACHIHIDSLSAWQYFATKIKSIKDLDYEIYITTTGNEDYPAEDLIKIGSDMIHITKVPARGADVLPYVDMLDKYNRKGFSSVLKLYIRSEENGKLNKADMKHVDALLGAQVQRQIAKNPEAHDLILPVNSSTEQDDSSVLDKVALYEKSAHVTLAELKNVKLQSRSFWRRLSTDGTLESAYILPEDFTFVGSVQADPMLRVFEKIVLKGVENIEVASIVGLKKVIKVSK